MALGYIPGGGGGLLVLQVERVEEEEDLNGHEGRRRIGTKDGEEDSKLIELKFSEKNS